MFFDNKFNKDHELGRAWRAGFGKIDDEEENLPDLCRKVDKFVGSHDPNPRKRMSLRTSAVLVKGTTNIYRQQMENLEKDVFEMNLAMVKRKRKFNVSEVDTITDSSDSYASSDLSIQDQTEEQTKRMRPNDCDRMNSSESQLSENINSEQDQDINEDGTEDENTDRIEDETQEETGRDSAESLKIIITDVNDDDGLPGSLEEDVNFADNLSSRSVILPSKTATVQRKSLRRKKNRKRNIEKKDQATATDGIFFHPRTREREDDIRENLPSGLLLIFDSPRYPNKIVFSSLKSSVRRLTPQ